MTGDELIFNAAILSIALTLFGLAWGFLILKIQGNAE